MSAMNSQPLDDFFAGQALGPPEAFYSFTSINADGTIDTDSPSFDEDDLEDDDWNIEDLIKFDEETSNDENEDPSSDASGTVEPSSTPARPTTFTSEDQVHPLLHHLQNGNVSAFRQNQVRHQLMNRNAITNEALEFSGKGAFNDGTLRGIKHGRLEAASVSMTPLRKQKRMTPLNALSPSSPLADVSLMNKKRKFDGQDFSGHKRNRNSF